MQRNVANEVASSRAESGLSPNPGSGAKKKYGPLKGYEAPTQAGEYLTKDARKSKALEVKASHFHLGFDKGLANHIEKSKADEALK